MSALPLEQERLPPLLGSDGEPELWPCWRDSGFVNASVCAVFQPDQSPLITGAGVKPAKKSRSRNGGGTWPEPCTGLVCPHGMHGHAVPGAGHMEDAPTWPPTGTSLVRGHNQHLSSLKQAGLSGHGQQQQKGFSARTPWRYRGRSLCQGGRSREPYGTYIWCKTRPVLEVRTEPLFGHISQPLNATMAPRELGCRLHTVKTRPWPKSKQPQEIQGGGKLRHRMAAW